MVTTSAVSRGNAFLRWRDAMRGTIAISKKTSLTVVCKFVDSFWWTLIAFTCIPFPTVALTNGTIIVTDINARPDVKESGIVCQNTNGIWKILCDNNGNLQRNAAQTAGQVCNVLGFLGYSRYGMQSIPVHGEKQGRQVQIDSATFNKHAYDRDLSYRFRRDIASTSGLGKGEDLRRDDKHGTGTGHGHNHTHHSHGHGHHHKHHKTEIVQHENNCLGLHVVCTPHAHIDSATHSKVPHKHKPKPTIEPITPVIAPNQIPVVIAHSNKTSTSHKEIETVKANENWPWIAHIYVNGDFKCLGVFLDRHWVLADEMCINKTR